MRRRFDDSATSLRAMRSCNISADVKLLVMFARTPHSPNFPFFLSSPTSSRLPPPPPLREQQHPTAVCFVSPSLACAPAPAPSPHLSCSPPALPSFLSWARKGSLGRKGGGADGRAGGTGGGREGEWMVAEDAEDRGRGRRGGEREERRREGVEEERGRRGGERERGRGEDEGGKVMQE
eukprot:747904-Hanusia_phi.AAC.3